VAERLRADASLTPWVREAAVRLAQASPEDAQKLNNVAWAVVKLPKQEPDAYQLALRRIRRACELHPEDTHLLNTFGVALYRVGAYDEALRALERSDRMNLTRNKESEPSDLAFLAMTCHRLGKGARAQTYLTRLREVLQTPRWANDRERQNYLREAEELIDPKKAPAK
jgi:Tfp pilus assembly protein PilF